MGVKSGLRRRILLALLGYAALLSLAVLAHGIFVNERAEQLVWETLLASELDQYAARTRADPAYRWADTETMQLYVGGDDELVPESLRRLAPGVHDEVPVAGREHVVLVREVDGQRLVLALDIADLEADELELGLTLAVSALSMVALLGMALAWGVHRLVRPLSDMAARIAALRPDRGGERIAVPADASAELVVIAEALNGYLDRHERFVERERAFVDSASHELRTPIAVIGGATELALGQPDVPPAVRGHLARIRRTASNVEQLVTLLLVLAKDPTRLAAAGDRVRLDQLLPEVVEDHRHLTAGKDLEVALADLPPCEVVAPVQILQAAIGNLLRNAIEHSDRGRIDVWLEGGATVVIDDPGHGMSPEEVSTIYARMARAPRRDGGGIGLDLIARLCEHLGWRLAIESGLEAGTRTTLSFGAAP